MFELFLFYFAAVVRFVFYTYFCFCSNEMKQKGKCSIKADENGVIAPAEREDRKN